MEKHIYIVKDFYNNPNGKVIGEANSFIKASKIRDKHLEETGLKHIKHFACNVAFLCELEGQK